MPPAGWPGLVPEVTWCPACRTLLLLRTDQSIPSTLLAYWRQYLCPGCGSLSTYIQADDPEVWSYREKGRLQNGRSDEP